MKYLDVAHLVKNTTLRLFIIFRHHQNEARKLLMRPSLPFLVTVISSRVIFDHILHSFFRMALLLVAVPVFPLTVLATI